MKRHGLRLLALLNAGLLVALLLMWVRPDGSLRGVLWLPPAPRLADYAAQLPGLPSPAPSDVASFVAMLERPLFAGTRRPPPPAPPPPVSAAVSEAPPDNFSTAKLTGVFQSGGASGVILRIADKDKRVQVNQVLEGWTLKSISGREATFVRGGETRVLQLQRASMVQAPAGASPAARARGLAPQPSLSPFLPAASVPPVNASVQGSSPGEMIADTLAPPADASPATTSHSAAAAVGANSAPKAPRAAFGGTRAQ